jgi:EpsI family protein
MTQWGRVLISCVLIAGTFLFLQTRSHGKMVLPHQPLDQFPTVVNDWKAGEGEIFGSDVLGVLQMSDYLMRRYTDSTGRNLWLYVGYWVSQGGGAVPHSPKSCLPGNGWEPIDSQRVQISVGAPPHLVEVNRYVVEKDGYRQLALYWYNLQGQVVSNDFLSRWITVKNAIIRNRTDGALIRITSPLYGSVEETFNYQVKYIQAMYPTLERFLSN